MALPHPDPALAIKMKSAALSIFQHALKESSIQRAFERHVQCERGILRIGEDLYDLSSYQRIFVVSLGKAAHTMATALVSQAGDRFEGVIVNSTEPPFHLRGFRYFLGGHPVPNEESLRAASSILKSLQAQTSESLVIYMISGGGSSMLEKPLDDEISLQELIDAYSVLVHSGAPIAEINAVRKHLSAVKGGRLAQAAALAQQVSILVSDVPQNTLDALASGPTMPDSTTASDCYQIATKHGMTKMFPTSVRELFQSHALDETPKSDDPAFLRSRWCTVLSNDAVLAAAKTEAERQGFLVEIDSTCDDWDYSAGVDYLLGRLRDLRPRADRVCLLSGGELTVTVRNPGVGGRNQQFALACAPKIAGHTETVLSAGTDGIDGNSPVAGGVIDGTTMSRAESQHLDILKALAEFDAYPTFARLDDAVMTGPTGNNLRDLRVLLSY